jgi:hypothetical protein
MKICTYLLQPIITVFRSERRNCSDGVFQCGMFSSLVTIAKNVVTVEEIDIK